MMGNMFDVVQHQMEYVFLYCVTYYYSLLFVLCPAQCNRLVTGYHRLDSHVISMNHKEPSV
jgi:hypothetical protein